VVASVLAVGGLTAAHASAAVTVGNNFTTTPTVDFCGNPCTVGLTRLPAEEQAPGGTSIATNGVIVRWRVMTAASPAPVQARLRILSGITTVAASSIETLPAAPGIHTFATRLPAHAGERLAVDLLDTTPATAPMVGRQTGDPVAHQVEFWMPPLTDGETRLPTNANAGLELYLNADIEPDVDGDGFGDETQDRCPTVAAPTTGCPPDTLITKRPKKRISVRRARFAFTSDVPGTTFECRLDKRPFSPCTSPTKLKRLKPGKHRFQVRAIDGASPDLSPATRKFRVLRAARRSGG
jgi:hypothetical protein